MRPNPKLMHLIWNWMTLKMADNVKKQMTACNTIYTKIVEKLSSLGFKCYSII